MPPPSTASSRADEKARKERERQDRERRYQEAKDRIFAGPANTNTKKKPTPPPPPPPPPPKQPQQRRQNPPLGSGAITGFSLNAGSLAAAPVRQRERQEWQLRQVAVDGKMLESQAQAYGIGRDEALLGDRERGLDWDEFRRDQWGGDGVAEVAGRLEKLDVVEFGESATEGGSKRGGGVAQPVREPRGPDGDGRGFGRGRGGRRGAH